MCTIGGVEEGRGRPWTPYIAILPACVLTHSAGALHAQAERDCPVLVNTCSEAARAFYMRNGFSEVGEPVVIGRQQHWWMVFPAQCPDVPVR